MYAPSLTTAGDVSVSGSLSAQQFIGDGSLLTGIGGGSALGDRITSGTLAMAANSATSVVSLSTGGTTWAYLSNVMSYLPRINAVRVSSTLISTTYIQISSATNVLACGQSLTGTMRYTSYTVQLCDGEEWNNVGVSVPKGSIMAFSSAACPPGWLEYTPSRGRFLRGIDTLAAGIDPSWVVTPMLRFIQSPGFKLVPAARLVWLRDGRPEQP
jgi:hypothetical protein